MLFYQIKGIFRRRSWLPIYSRNLHYFRNLYPLKQKLNDYLHNTENSEKLLHAVKIVIG